MSSDRPLCPISSDELCDYPAGQCARMCKPMPKPEMLYVPLNLGTPEQRWCPDCLLSSALDYPVTVVTASGVTTLGIVRTCVCRMETHA